MEFRLQGDKVISKSHGDTKRNFSSDCFFINPRAKILEFSLLNVDFLAGNLLFVSSQKTHFDLVFGQATWKQEKREKEIRQERFDEYESVRKTWNLGGITCNQR